MLIGKIGEKLRDMLHQTTLPEFTQAKLHELFERRLSVVLRVLSPHRRSPRAGFSKLRNLLAAEIQNPVVAHVDIFGGQFSYLACLTLVEFILVEALNLRYLFADVPDLLAQQIWYLLHASN